MHTSDSLIKRKNFSNKVAPTLVIRRSKNETLY